MTPEQKKLLERLCRNQASFEQALELFETIAADLRNEVAFLTGILARINDAVVALDTEGRVTFWNRAAEKLFGHTREEALGRPFDAVVRLDWSERDRATIRELLHRLGDWKDELILHRPQQEDDRHVALSFVLLRDQNGEHTGELIIARDVTHRVRHEERLLFNAMHDALTGLANRSLFLSRLWKAISEAQADPQRNFAVLFLDLDRFKLINDSFGHQTGDRLLMQVARRFKECLRPEDVVARMGGDEFAFLLYPVQNLTEAQRMADRILDTLAAPFALDKHEVFITGSIGIVFGSAGYTRPEDILRDADTAMYRSKDAGTGTHRAFEPSMQTRARFMLQLETDLHHAIEREEFVTYYQPILDMADGSIAGFEALVRWHHPERGLLKPSQFVPYAEETGLIVPIERRVLREACRQTRHWQKEYPGAERTLISVNVSIKQLQRADFVDYVRTVLDETGLAPQQLMLEITERVFMDESDVKSTGLSQLNDMPVNICMDDFGTGYSSLSKLHGLPVSTLKLDRSFTARIVDHARGLEMVRAIVNMAHNLGIQIIAEGIETPAQLALVRQLGCHYGQGFLFTPPIDAAATTDLLGSTYPWQSYW